MQDKEKLSKLLEDEGFEICSLGADVVGVKGKGITAAFSLEYYVDDFYSCVQRTFVADNNRAFDKWTNCPMYMPIEDAIKDFPGLLKMLEWLATDEGCDYSSTYAFYDEPKKLPYKHNCHE